MRLDNPVTALKGVGPKKALILSRLGINKLEDFLYHYPRQYQDRRIVTKIKDLKDKDFFLIVARVLKISGGQYFYGRQNPLRLFCEDDTSTIEILFFNPKYYLKSFAVGSTYSFYGKASVNGNIKKMAHPDYRLCESGSFKEEGEGIVAIYPLSKGISRQEMERYQRQVSGLSQMVSDYMPQDIVEKNRLCDLSYALENIHFPKDEQKLKEAKFRLVFDELFLLQTGLLMKRLRKRKSLKNHRYLEDIDEVTHQAKGIKGLEELFPFPLTSAQKRVWSEVRTAMESPLAMNRLIQGDVGSGKTVIAALALYKAAKSGFQGVLMAPTELLAKQHFETISDLFENLGISVGILVSSMAKKEKNQVLERLESGEISVLIGTHAVIEDYVNFKNLSLVITDEQHRFGVDQRIKLSDKGVATDTLVMTATPIPRTLAAILYGDLDISIIDELPPGRPEVLTKKIGDQEQRKSMYSFIKSELAKGRQAYIVTPLIEESEVLDVRSAEEVYKELSLLLAPYNVGLLHGNMKSAEKDSLMNDFKEGIIKILVSTVVIEVGIHVDNATIMAIENAERFGLAQLHQLRGRIGRGKEKSYCFLISESDTDFAKERIAIMEKTRDGFYIAEKDLELRGPGEVFGTKQHGIPELVIADLSRHLHILERVRAESKALLDKDPLLEKYPLLSEKIQGFMAKATM